MSWADMTDQQMFDSYNEAIRMNEERFRLNREPAPVRFVTEYRDGEMKTIPVPVEGHRKP
jgi:hypothetical protein